MLQPSTLVLESRWTSVVWLLVFQLEDKSVFVLYHLQILYSCIDHIHFEMHLKNGVMYNLWYFRSLLASYIVISFFLVGLSNCFSTWAILELFHNLSNHDFLSFVSTGSELSVSLSARKVHPNQEDHV